MNDRAQSSFPRIAITGASGNLGIALCQCLGEYYDIIAISHTRTIPVQLAAFRVKQDLTDRQRCDAMLDNLKPQAVIHTAALSDPNYCELNKTHSKVLNWDLAKHLAQSCAERLIGFYFTSTDLVFDGSEGNYCEQDAINPLNTYGEHKALAEEWIQMQHPDAVIFRLPWMFGHYLLGDSELSHWLDQLQTGQPIWGFADEYRSAVSYGIAAKGITQLVQRHEQEGSGRLPGDLYHLGGIETVSRLFTLQQVAQLLKIGDNLIVGKKQREIEMPARRPADVSLDSRKARSAGFKSPFFRDMLRAELSWLEAV